MIEILHVNDVMLPKSLPLYILDKKVESRNYFLY